LWPRLCRALRAPAQPFPELHFRASAEAITSPTLRSVSPASSGLMCSRIHGPPPRPPRDPHPSSNARGSHRRAVRSPGAGGG
jgi:hypothetical protein